MSKRAKPTVLCDTNIYFRAFRGDPTILQELNHIGFDRLALSSITKGEIYFGMKDSEVTRTKVLLNLFKTYPLSTEISIRFERMMYQYRKLNPQLPDCLIAATALSTNAQLFTLNRKDFTFYRDLTLYNPIYSH